MGDVIEPRDDDAFSARLDRYFTDIEREAAGAPVPQDSTFEASAASLAAARARRRRLAGGLIGAAAAAAIALLALAPGDDAPQELATGGDRTTAAPPSAVATSDTAPATTRPGPTSTALVTTPPTVPPTTPTTSPTASSRPITSSPLTWPPVTVAPPPPPPPPPDVLYRDDFQDDALGTVPDGWVVGTGTWAVAAGSGGDRVLAVTSGPGVEARISAPAAGVRDARASTTLVFGPGGELGGVGLRYAGPGDYLFCKASRTDRQLYLGRVTGGSVQVLAQAAYTPPAGVALRVELRAADAALRCAVGGGPTITATGQGPASGSLALLATGDVRFSDAQTRVP